VSLPAAALSDLRRRFGEDVVRSDATHRRVYDSDGYALDGVVPDAVLLPRTEDEVREIVGWCARREVPFVARGAGTGLSGGCLTPGGGVQIGLARLREILEVDPERRVAVVQSGVVNLELNQALASTGLCFAPDPSSQAACTVGGNFAENSGGPHTLKVGVTSPHVLGARVVTPDGEWMEVGGSHLPAGPDLLGLLVGSEGTLGIATRFTLRLTPVPAAVATFLGVFPTVGDAARAVSGMVARAIVPAAMELIDQVMLRAVEEAFRFGFPLDAGAVLIVELDGPPQALAHEREVVREVCAAHHATELREARDAAERQQLWRARKHAFGAIGRMAPNYATQDGVVPRGKVPDIVEAIRAASERHAIRIGTVLHAGDGNIHPCVLFDQADPEEVDRALAASGDILRRCIELDGTPTGEHGIGMEKREFLPLLYGPTDLDAMHDVKHAFDPDSRCNPHKILPGSGGCGELRVAGRQVSS